MPETHKASNPSKGVKSPTVNDRDEIEDTRKSTEFYVASTVDVQAQEETLEEKKAEVRRKLRERRVPSSPMGRVMGFAQLGASLVYGTLSDQVSQYFRGAPASDSKDGRPANRCPPIPNALQAQRRLRAWPCEQCYVAMQITILSRTQQRVNGCNSCNILCHQLIDHAPCFPIVIARKYDGFHGDRYCYKSAVRLPYLALMRCAPEWLQVPHRGKRSAACGCAVPYERRGLEAGADAVHPG